MTTEIAKLFATGLTIAFGVALPAIAMGMIGSKALESIGRNPETENAVRTTMIIAIAFAESLAIFTLIVALVIKFV